MNQKTVEELIKDVHDGTDRLIKRAKDAEARVKELEDGNELLGNEFAEQTTTYALKMAELMAEKISLQKQVECLEGVVKGVDKARVETTVYDKYGNAYSPLEFFKSKEALTSLEEIRAWKRDLTRKNRTVD